MTKLKVDLVIFAAHVIPVLPRDVVLHDAAIVVNKARVVALLPRVEAQERFIGAEEQHLGRHIVMPGLINLHTHAPMTLFRGLGDDKMLHDWLAEDIWPTEKNGTTCFNNMYFFPNEICGVLESTGMRGAPNLEKFAPGRHDLITVTMAPHSPYTVGEHTLLKVDALVRKYNARIHIHLHETEAECNDSEQLNRASMCCHKSDQKLRPLANFKRLGLLSDRLICAHMTQLTDEEIDDVARAGAHVVHCPSSNLKLASGIARVTEMLRRGVNVTLGTDGAASNNSLDILGEMKLAAMLAKAESHDCTSVSAAEALQMATLNGARALGLEHEIGSIE
ncbi:5-methylthioadenosine/S-adenosylhomocysteine deaminase, putative [Phytophthora infestans T30-4]|uniref:5-methylthioadenosine/S-adenosylhomocysteine deaminase, putative n=1 Tax=Phytophthora infestans (strain T30-4) TaxID=403677 RepID=D0MY15_PHYIT|nr:5-methylthioadenosine/S-adenosylhomocysteine deaminase, putative [Phytophthora infestans T30-4]EEY66063.1 5-methylthioadenosine/S-adenosylhomocysteine deaminase, putative [Phytophthora infestans T30-4]|eukprot:XP_002906662.1 5-methylthioadenosine/S-adenosylhomocysteine deaminase, putative [Phytophthora infestans T30-4]